LEGFIFLIMKTNDKHLKNENELKDKNKKLMELAASRLAEIFVAQIEFNKNKNKNIYEKRR